MTISFASINFRGEVFHGGETFVTPLVAQRQRIAKFVYPTCIQFNGISQRC